LLFFISTYRFYFIVRINTQKA